MKMTNPRWEKFRDFFQITIFRYLVVWFSVVPVLAAMFASLPQSLLIPLGESSQFTINLTLPFSWQMLWLSSLFFLIAWSIYIFRCPSFVKKYNKYSDYQSYGHDHRDIVWEASRFLASNPSNIEKKKFVERLITKKYLDTVEKVTLPENIDEPIVEEKQTCMYFTFNNKWYRLGMPIYENGLPSESAKNSLFWEIFGRFSGSRPCSRVFIIVFLVISASLFLIVLGQHILAGGIYVWNWLF